VLAAAGDKELRLRVRDVIGRRDRVDRQRQLAHGPVIQAALALAQGRQQTGAEDAIVVEVADQAVLDGPPVQAREQRRLRGLHVGSRQRARRASAAAICSALLAGSSLRIDNARTAS
jgi:hypothetical protein